MTTLVRLNQYRGRSINLERTPRYLRFVVRGSNWQTLDALDHPEDRWCWGETIIPAKLVDTGTVHADRIVNGRRVGVWRTTANYDPVECCLTQEQLRDNEAWREWCEQLLPNDSGAIASRDAVECVVDHNEENSNG